ENILEILYNPEYKNHIRRMSDAFRNQPMTARQRALFWIEHVIKHGGGHLRCSAMDLSMFQFLCLDTVGLFVFIII
ncbi:hypothetical protein HELRODRAFT_147640, partial [Helobdella robusta]|uniref:Uncharacterized protein n=1 Tax=Helobdella robusta TaxID=6412 RepID=T1EK18_HELRO